MTIMPFTPGLCRAFAMADKCKQRGGDCPCTGECQADVTLRRLQTKLNLEYQAVAEKLAWLKTPPATVRPGFTLNPPDGYYPVAHCDGEECTWGYENDDGDWIEEKEWPFNEQWVYADDWERLGFELV